MIVELGFPLILNFATLYLDKTQSLHFLAYEGMYYKMLNFHEFC